MDRIISSYLSEFIKNQEIKEKDISKQFEAFAAYSTISQRYDDTFELSDVMTGTGGDCGIDAIAIICNGALINATDEVDDLIEMNKNISEVEFIFIQAKTSSNFSGSEIGTFGAGIKDFFSDSPGMVQNNDIRNKKKIIDHIYSKASKLRNNPTDDQLMTLGEFHKNLEDYYNSFEGNKRLYYERRSKQYAYSADVEKVRIVSVSTQIKSIAAMFFDRPHMAARYYGRLLKNVGGLFDKNDKLVPYYTSAYVLYKLEFLFRNKMLDSRYRKYRFHLMMLLKYDAAGKINKVPRLSENKIEDFCKGILQCAYDNDLFVTKINDLCKIINNNVTDIDDQEMTKSGTLVENLKAVYQ